MTNPGGHSSRPVPDNAIYRLAAGLLKISAYQFPFQASDITRAYFGKMAPQVGGDMGKAMTAFANERHARPQKHWPPIPPTMPCCTQPASPRC